MKSLNNMLDGATSVFRVFPDRRSIPLIRTETRAPDTIRRSLQQDQRKVVSDVRSAVTKVYVR